MGRKQLGVVAKSYTITFDQALFVSKYADAKGCPESHVVRMAIQAVLDKYKTKWECLVCDAVNDIAYNKCWDCGMDKGTQKAK